MRTPLLDVLFAFPDSFRIHADQIEFSEVDDHLFQILSGSAFDGTNLGAVTVVPSGLCIVESIGIQILGKHFPVPQYSRRGFINTLDLIADGIAGNKTPVPLTPDRYQVSHCESTISACQIVSGQILVADAIILIQREGAFLIGADPQMDAVLFLHR